MTKFGFIIDTHLFLCFSMSVFDSKQHVLYKIE